MSVSILYSIKIGGGNIKLYNIQYALEYIYKNSYYKNVEIQLFVETNINIKVLNFLKNLNKSYIKLFFDNKLSWYQWLTKSFHHAENFKYLITTHDDVYIMTKNFDKILDREISDLDNLGSFSFKDDGYKRRLFNPQTRGAFHLDRIYNDSRAKGIEAEYHLQKPNWHKKCAKLRRIYNVLSNYKKNETIEIENNLQFEFASKLFLNYSKIDFPKKKIRVHSFWTALMGFKVQNLKNFKINDFDVSHGLFADEDICLSTQNNNLTNILLPEVSYYHDRDMDISRSWKDIKRDYEKVSNIFKKKWDYYPTKIEFMSLKERLDLINFLTIKYDNKFTWSKDFNSYDYIYL